MTERIYCKRAGEVKKNKSKIEKETGVKIIIDGGNVEFSGGSVEEYEAGIILDAIDFGFTAKQALVLADEGRMFRKIHIRGYTKRNLKAVRSRLIGIDGKTRRTIEDISNCKVLITESDVGIIGDTEDVTHAATAVINIIKGSKQSNMYAYLEKMNRIKKSLAGL